MTLVVILVITARFLTIATMTCEDDDQADYGTSDELVVLTLLCRGSSL